MGRGYPKPDRSGFRPNFVKTAENDAIDIGWQEGTFADGRPYRAEAWCMDQATFLTIYCSSIGLEQASPLDLAELLNREGLVQILSPEGLPRIQAGTDASDQPILAITLMVGADEETFLRDNIPLRPYERGGE
jgi:hypothetical protein